MPKVTMTFNLPDERWEFDCAKQGADWKSIVYEVSMFLRNALKHGHDYKSADEALEAAKAFLWQECNDNHLDPWCD